LSSVGVVAYNGYTAGAKESACKGNFRTIVKAVYENIMWCELNPTINFLWSSQQSREYDCGNLEEENYNRNLNATSEEILAKLTVNQLGNMDRIRELAAARGKETKLDSRSTLKTMTNPYTGYTVLDAASPNAYYYGDNYDMRGKVTLGKKDSSGNELGFANWKAEEEGQLFLITKCRDKVIEYEFDIY
ncbi:MAG: pilus assembly protein, partial [Nitrosomonadales bacterium]|nr:pilus assembly protein [Nitrosomonadales bacterium]